MKKAKWTVHYGCEEWQDSERHSEKKARARFSEILSQPPINGLYSATYVMLYDANGDTVESQNL